MESNIFFHISILFGVTVTMAALVRLLRQPLIIAYLLAGIIAGPLFLNLVGQGDTLFHAFAQLGVVLLLFVVGLSLNVSHIRQIGRVAVTAGILQLIATGVIGFGILIAVGLPTHSAAALAVASVFSSTVIIIKLLGDKNALESVYGRYTVGLLLVQDVIAILLMIFLTTKTDGEPLLGMLLLAWKGMLLGIFIYTITQYVLPPLLRRIAHSPEFLFLCAIAWCFGIASIVQLVGFSLEIGAVIAGLSLGSSPFQLEIMSRIKPLRDFFIIIFFIILGSELELGSLSGALLPSVLLSAFILIGNPIILYKIYRSHRFTRHNSFLGGITAAQVSEFGFILLFTARGLGLLSGNELAIFTLTALTTIFLSSYLVSYNEQIFHILTPFLNLFGKDKYIQKESVPVSYSAWVIGYHRIGWKICEGLQEAKVKFAVIDHNPETIGKLKKRKIPAYFGDISDVEFLSALPLVRADLVVITVPDPDTQLTMIRYIRSVSKKTMIVGNLHHSANLEDLYHAGANFVMMPHLLGGDWMSALLGKKQWTPAFFSRLKKEQRDDLHLRHTADAH